MKQKNIDDLPRLDLTRMENLFSIYQDNNVYFYNLLNTINFKRDDINPSMYITYNVLLNDTYTNISYKNYDTINLWWLVCSFNGINDPTSLPEPGTTLNILRKEYVSDVLNTIYFYDK